MYYSQTRKKTMHSIPDTSRNYRTKENTFISCDFGSFSAALTNKRLVISNKQFSESIQLQQIRGVTIVDDYEQYSLNMARYIRKTRRVYQCVGAFAGSVGGYMLTQSFFFPGIPIGATAGLALSSFLPITTKSVSTPSLLLVITEQGIKEYPFQQHSNNNNVASLARFMLLIEEALYKLR